MAQDKANKCNTYDETILTTELECCYNEFKFYKNEDNEIAALGWAVSYNLQVLWQNSPKIDKPKTLPHGSIQKQTKTMNEEEKKRFKEIQDFLKSHNIEPLTLYYTPYPRNIEKAEEKMLRKRAEKYSHCKGDKENPVREYRRPIQFYTTLDWDKFYTKFPLIQQLSGEYLRDKAYIKKDIYSKNFREQVNKAFLCNAKTMETLNNLPEGEHKLYFAIDVSSERSNKNKDSYTLVKDGGSIPKNYKLISACKPYEIDNLNFQVSGVGDEDFIRQALMSVLITIGAQCSVDTAAVLASKHAMPKPPPIWIGLLAYETYGFGKKLNQESLDKMRQNLSLYACSGKFSINYAPTCITIKKQQDGIEYRVDEMVAYVYDSFDFLDQSHTFNDDGTISKLGQPVGAWDFKEKAFSIWGSLRQMKTYKPDLLKRQIIGYAIPGVLSLSPTDILEARKNNRYYIYNQDYQDYQKFTEYGLDFKLYSENVIATIDCSHCEFHTLYKRYNCDV